MLAIARTGPAEAAFWQRTVDRLDQQDGDFERAAGLIASSGADDATLDLASNYAVAAKAQLAEFAASNSWRPALEDLADFAVSRRM